MITRHISSALVILAVTCPLLQIKPLETARLETIDAIISRIRAEKKVKPDDWQLIRKMLRTDGDLVRLRIGNVLFQAAVANDHDREIARKLAIMTGNRIQGVEKIAWAAVLSNVMDLRALWHKRSTDERKAARAAADRASSTVEFWFSSRHFTRALPSADRTQLKAWIWGEPAFAQAVVFETKERFGNAPLRREVRRFAIQRMKSAKGDQADYWRLVSDGFR